MPSLQSRITRLTMKYVMGRMFQRRRSIPEWRNTLDQLVKCQKIPAGTEIWPIMWHIFQLNARFVPEARQSIAEIGGFVLKHLSEGA